MDPETLVGRRLERIVTARPAVEDGTGSLVVDVWLVDDQGGCTLITTGSDWCLIVRPSDPYGGYDMQEYGRVDVSRDATTPFEQHIGERIVMVREEWDPMTGRVALLVGFETGEVRCDGWEGDLRLTPAVPARTSRSRPRHPEE